MTQEQNTRWKAGDPQCTESVQELAVCIPAEVRQMHRHLLRPSWTFTMVQRCNPEDRSLGQGPGH